MKVLIVRNQCILIKSEDANISSFVTDQINANSPFGTRCCTYGNDASRKYYSQVYVKHGLNKLYGLNPL